MTRLWKWQDIGNSKTLGMTRNDLCFAPKQELGSELNNPKQEPGSEVEKRN